MALKNFSKIKLTKDNKTYWKLYDIKGNEIEVYTNWTFSLQDKYSFQTRDKYSQVISKFLDYLVEVNIFEKVTTRIEIKTAIENYKKLLSKGKDISDEKLNKVAHVLDFNKISPASWSNNIAAINSFLEYNEELYKDRIDYLSVKNNVKLPEDYNSILSTLKSIDFLNNYQKKALKEKSYLSHLYKITNKIKTTGMVKSNHTTKYNKDFKNLDFPAIEIPNLLNNTSCFRDRAIYSLLAGTGIRSSEALSLTWDMVDIDNQKVYIYNSKEKFDNEDIKFKGRETNLTFFIPELRHIFFQALYEYQLNEADNSANHNYVFHFLKGKAYGDPYYTVSRQAFIKEFKKTVKRANIKSPQHLLEHIWTPHSLRHFYGVYMLNYIPLSDRHGFSIEEVQRMMGHKSINVTQQYARRTEDYIKEQLHYAEENINNNALSLENISSLLSINLKGNNND